MKRTEFEELREKVFGAIEYCQRDLANNCTDCPYERDSCYFDLCRDRDKLLFALNAEYDRLLAENAALKDAAKSVNVDAFAEEHSGSEEVDGNDDRSDESGAP